MDDIRSGDFQTTISRKSTLEVLPFFQLKLILVINRIELAISFQGCIYKWVESSTLQNGTPSDIPCLGNLHRSFAFCWPQSHAEYDANSVAEDVKHMLPSSRNIEHVPKEITLSENISLSGLEIMNFGYTFHYQVIFYSPNLHRVFRKTKNMPRIAVKMIGWSICWELIGTSFESESRKNPWNRSKFWYYDLETFCWVKQTPPSPGSLLEQLCRHGETPPHRSGLDETAATRSGEKLSVTGTWVERIWWDLVGGIQNTFR